MPVRLQDLRNGPYSLTWRDRTFIPTHPIGTAERVWKGATEEQNQIENEHPFQNLDAGKRFRREPSIHSLRKRA